MAWNEPGNNGNGNDPWGGGRRGGDQGPPDIDEVIKNLTKKVNGLFGSGSGRSNGGGTSQGPSNMSGGLLVGLVAVGAIIWGFMGFYVVDEAERGVVLRFGEVQDATVAPGLHWNPPVVDEVNLVNVSQLNAKTYENRAMLTTDENIIDIDVTVQYVIQDPVNYVIAVQDPERSLDNAAESAIRHEVGSNFMDQILTTGREQMAAAVQDRLQEYMDNYNTGIRVARVNVVQAQPPDAVRPAFDDVIRAREDEQRAQNQAQQYANQRIPEARGEAQRQIEQANAYKQQAIAQAEGEASRFDQLLIEYQKAPEVTRQRLYIESLQDVMTASSKIMIDVEGGNNMLYVPLDKIMEQNATAGRLGGTTQDLRDLANQLAPFLPGPSTANSVDRTRLGSGRGVRP
ncbi:MAG: FtsH protease activity modulator HflK [Pseudomonadota bacterium]|nr:FtsH protease activity modulator HflK [Pseudomonadota bacterium]MEC8332194.1 FtsH protease activity modulator HflK [Pseudomonadota bacterium]MEC8431164.1 FtsH protease activity modulator HflK [Pseudomonadota bacterium]MEC8454060.1 FtsH protease activity modulator HflK [Pseudomonadota bacterium]MEC8587450.1 FtsH protease activity modulator HflK [Pseudomonadota bacterium]